MASTGFSVQIKVEFCAAHHIKGYDGDCARPHGHNFKVEVLAVTNQVNHLGIAVDFKVLKALTNKLIAKYDHQDLNTIAPFDDINPTAETLAQHFYTVLESEIKMEPVTQNLILRQVTIWENDRSAASFGLLN